jgi:hypothetical protein
MKFTLLLLSLLSLSCSGPKSKDTIEETKQNFKSPEKIGTLPDGREIFLVKREMGTALVPHYIYFVGSTITINNNNGKHSQIAVLIDGVEYTKKEGAETP